MLGYLYLFKPDPEKPIWIDAICINQDDADEKAVQVSLMHRIYSRAQCVVVWMGQSTAESNYFLAEIRKLPAQLDADRYHHDALMRHHEDNEIFWQGMASVFSKPWFERLWTFQEIVLAKTAQLLCGKLWLDMDKLLELLESWFVFNAPGTLTAHIDWRNVDAISYIRVFRNRRESVWADEIPTLLHRTRLRQVGEPVDRIWALYGLFKEDVRQVLGTLIDYSDVSRSRHWLTMIGCMKKIIQMEQNLALLSLPNSANTRPPYLPSWCPDLSGMAGTRAVIMGEWNLSTDTLSSHLKPFVVAEDERRTMLRRGAVSRHSERYCSALESIDILQLRGFVVDTVSEVIEDSRLIGAWNDRNFFRSIDNPQHIRAVRWLFAGLDLFYRTIHEATGGDTDESLDFLMAFWTDHRINEHARAAFWDLLSISQVDGKAHLPLLDPERDQNAFYAKKRFNSLVGHSFFSTFSGRFGLAAPGCKLGDQVCVLYGGHPLYIIRPQRNNDSAVPQPAKSEWQFVGTAYIPHLMDQHTSDDARQGPDQIFSLA